MINVKRFKTTIDMPGLFKSGVEFIEYVTEKGTFYEKGGFRLDKKGLIFDIYNQILIKKEINSWFEPLKSISFYETEEFNLSTKKEIKNQIDFIESRLRDISSNVDFLKQKRDELIKILHNDSK